MKIKLIARFVITSGASLIAGLGLWFALLGADALSYFMQGARHMHQKGLRPFSLVGTPWTLDLFYSLSFLIGTAIVSRRTWSYRPASASLLGYLTFLGCYCVTLDYSRGPSIEFYSLGLPLLSAPIGALICRRLFPIRNAEQGAPADSPRGL